MNGGPCLSPGESCIYHGSKSPGAITFTITPPADFINANDRPHHHAKAKLTKAWREQAALSVPKLRPIVRPGLHGALAVLAGFEPNTFARAHVIVSYRFPNNRRREVSNLQPTSKAIVDGLVDAGVLPDDDDRHVIGPDNRRTYPNGEPEVTITITPLENP